MEANKREVSKSSNRMPGSGSPRKKEGQEGIILTKKAFTLLKAARSSRSMWGRLAGKWVQLFSGGASWFRLAPTPAKRTRQHSSTESGMVEICFFCKLALWFGFARASPLLRRPAPPVSPFYIVGSGRPCHS